MKRRNTKVFSTCADLKPRFSAYGCREHMHMQRECCGFACAVNVVCLEMCGPNVCCAVCVVGVHVCGCVPVCRSYLELNHRRELRHLLRQRVHRLVDAFQENPRNVPQILHVAQRGGATVGRGADIGAGELRVGA